MLKAEIIEVKKKKKKNLKLRKAFLVASSG